MNEDEAKRSGVSDEGYATIGETETSGRIRVNSSSSSSSKYS